MKRRPGHARGQVTLAWHASHFMRTRILTLALLALCADAPLVAAEKIPGVVTGTVTYRERIALPPEAVVEVQLRNVSLTDVNATVVASQTIERPPQVPIPFRLEFDPGQIEPRYSYVISARITIGERLAFINSQSYLVLTRGHPARIEMTLQKVDRESSAEDEAAEPPVEPSPEVSAQ